MRWGGGTNQMFTDAFPKEQNKQVPKTQMEPILALSKGRISSGVTRKRNTPNFPKNER